MIKSEQMNLEDYGIQIYEHMKPIIGEEWRPIKGSDNAEVSNLGRVRQDGKILKLTPDPCEGYLRVKVRGRNDTRFVHRFVAEAFLPNPLNKKSVDHIVEGDRHNNRVDNLQWLTIGENTKKAGREGRLRGRRRCPIVMIREEDGVRCAVNSPSLLLFSS